MSDNEVDLELIAQKIAKIRALAEQGSTPEECAAAASKMAELMERYALSAVQIDAAGIASDDRAYGHQTVEGYWDYRGTIMQALAKDFRCRVVGLRDRTYYGRDHKLDIIGQKDDVRACIDTYTWIVSEVQRLCEVRWTLEGKHSGEHGKSWKNAYRTFCASAIARRLANERREREAQRDARTSNALIVLDKRVTETVNKIYPKLTNERTSCRANVRSSGATAGSRDGRSMALKRAERIANNPARYINDPE